LAERAGKLLDDLVPSIRKTADLVQEISSASKEQTSGLGQINTSISQLSQTTQSTASASEELSSTSEETSAQALQLQKAISYFKTSSTSTFAPRPHALPSQRAATARPPARVVRPSVSAEESSFSRF
jgi:methyl-accepting chemotaxis protein